MNHRTLAITTVLAITGAFAQTSMAQDSRHTVRLTMPAYWRNITVCTHEGDTARPPVEVAIGNVGVSGSPASRFVIRPVTGEALPGYLDGQLGRLNEKEREVAPAQGVAYTDEYYEVFVMPSGVRLSCQFALGD